MGTPFTQSAIPAQVTPCTKRFVHDWVTCPLSHPGEKAKRRDPRKSGYTGIACPAMKKVRSSRIQLKILLL